jgi:hypothetical protein
MNTLAVLILLFSLPGTKVSSPARPPVDKVVAHAAHRGGKWYFAQTGHAVFCFGPVMTITQAQGGLQRVATFCQGDQTMVPLRD